ncbi:MAG: COP23 domain-containing protein [Cyanobacteria bacterium J06649_11]
MVSRRFQQFNDHDKLRYIKGGYVKGLPVVCAVKNQEDSCNKNNVLYTLRPGQNPQDTARRLFNNRGLAGGMIVNESGSNSLIIDFDAFLENAGGSRRSRSR